MKLKNTLPKEITGILTEDTLKVLEDAINEKIELNVEAALVDQDKLYSEKLTELIDVRDNDYTNKFKRALTVQEKAFTHKLKSVVRKYEGSVKNDAGEFMNTLVENISNYLEEYIDESIPTEAIVEATQNRTAHDVLSNLRNVLSVDSALMSESVKEAVVDGKQTISNLEQKVNLLATENDKLIAENTATKTKLILNEKTAGFNAEKADYIVRVLGDKTPQFINENFDYTVRLFERDEKKQRASLKSQALKQRVVTEEVAMEKPVTKSAPITEGTASYLPELHKAK